MDTKMGGSDIPSVIRKGLIRRPRPFHINREWDTEDYSAKHLKLTATLSGNENCPMLILNHHHTNQAKR